MKKKNTNGVGFIVIGVLLTLFSLIFICDGIHVLISYDKKEMIIVNSDNNVIEVNDINNNKNSYIISKKIFQKKGDIINIYVPKDEKKKVVTNPISFISLIALCIGIFGIYKGSKKYKRKRRK